MASLCDLCGLGGEIFGLSRRPQEPLDQDLRAFYQRFLAVTTHDVFRTGQWRLCERTGWPDNPSYMNVLAWCWERGDERYLVAVNFSGTASQALVRVALDDLRAKAWRLSDPLSGETYKRSGDEMAGPGLFVSLNPWRWHFFRLDPLG